MPRIDINYWNDMNENFYSNLQCAVMFNVPNFCKKLLPFDQRYILISLPITFALFPIIIFSFGIANKYNKIIEEYCPACLRPSSLSKKIDYIEKYKTEEILKEVKAPRIENFDSQGRYIGYSQAESRYIKDGIQKIKYKEERKFKECEHCKYKTKIQIRNIEM